MKTTIIATLLLLSAAVGLADDKPQHNVVRVTGTSEVKVIPDQALISLGVEKQNASAISAKHAADSAARSLLSSLRANGVAEKDMQTTFLSLQPVTTYVKHVRQTMFVAEQTLTITVRDISKLDSLLEALVKAGGNRIDSIQYETSNPRKYRDQAREMAVVAAKEKAQALAAALGQSIGKASSIDEGTDFSSQLLSYNYNNSSLNAQDNKIRGNEASTVPGERSVTATVTIAFELN